MKITTTPTYLADICERTITMNNASPEIREQCDFLLDWMQDRIEQLLLEELYDEVDKLKKQIKKLTSENKKLKAKAK